MYTTDTDNQGIHHRSSEVNRPHATQSLRTSTLLIITISLRVRATTAPAAEEAPAPDLLGLTPRWALSPLDWQAHAIDPWADHPFGVWIARCGHRLLGGSTLHDEPPGFRCPSCTRWSHPGRCEATGTTQ